MVTKLFPFPALHFIQCEVLLYKHLHEKMCNSSRLQADVRDPEPWGI